MYDISKRSGILSLTTIKSALVALFCLVLFGQAFAKEDVDVIGGRFDFGYVPFGTTIKHRAVLVNQCDSIVKITRVVPGCGCTQIPLKKKELAPGESLEVEIILETGKIRQGLFQKAPVFYTDNRETPRITITLMGFNLKPDDNQPPIKVSPVVVHLQKSQPNAVGSIEIVNNTGRNIIPKMAAGAQPDFLQIEMPYRQISPGQKETISVKLVTDSLREDTTDESITIVFNDQKQSRFTIPISITR